MIVLHSQSMYFAIAALEVIWKILSICSLHTVSSNVETIQNQKQYGNSKPGHQVVGCPSHTLKNKEKLLHC